MTGRGTQKQEEQNGEHALPLVYIIKGMFSESSPLFALNNTTKEGETLTSTLTAQRSLFKLPEIAESVRHFELAQGGRSLAAFVAYSLVRSSKTEWQDRVEEVCRL